MSYTTQEFSDSINRIGRTPKFSYPFVLESDCFRWYISNARHDPVLYVVRAENGLFKIGRTCGIVSRVHALDNMSPIPIQFYHLILTNNAYESEKELHRRHAPHWVRGEWFRLSEDGREFLESTTRYDYQEARYPGWHDYRNLKRDYGRIEVARK
jgi:hypothetical protein